MVGVTLSVICPLGSELEDREHSSRPAVIDNDQIDTLIKNNPGHATRDIAEILHVSNMRVVRNLKEILDM